VVRQRYKAMEVVSVEGDGMDGPKLWVEGGKVDGGGMHGKWQVYGMASGVNWVGENGKEVCIDKAQIGCSRPMYA